MRAFGIAISFFALVWSVTFSPVAPKAVQTRLEKIQSMYAWEGFVYDIEACQNMSTIVSDFSRMRSMGGRNVIIFDYCGTGADASYYDMVITAAGLTDINIIPMVWTLPIHPFGQNYTANDTFLIKSVPRIEAVTQAVIRNPGPVLAVALGDEPLFDNDAGSADNLATYILAMKANFSAAGLHDMPVSISDQAVGWQYTPGNATKVADAVDLFMINNLPYFNSNANWGGGYTAWSDFMANMDYFQSISQGKPIMVTQTGFPSNLDAGPDWASNSSHVIATLPSEIGFWKLLDGHCEDYFKPANIGWMWRNWDDAIPGWGALYDNGTEKFRVEARLTC